MRPQCWSSKHARISPCDLKQHQLPSGCSVKFNSWIISYDISFQLFGHGDIDLPACTSWSLLMCREFGIKTVLVVLCPGSFGGENTLFIHLQGAREFSYSIKQTCGQILQYSLEAQLLLN